MSENKKVVWSEGMFLLPQHFQQHDRYLETLIDRRCLGLQPYDWGFYSLTIDVSLLKSGKFGINECTGIFPDGTPFNLPGDDEVPVAIDIPQDIQNEFVYLALPLRRPETVETDSHEKPESLARFRSSERDVRDNNSEAEGNATLKVGKLKTRFLLHREELSGYTRLAVARIVEARSDRTVVLGDPFIPANLNCRAMANLRGFLQELKGLLHTRGEELGGRVAGAAGGGVAEVADFLLLQLVNRYEPLFEHLSNVNGLHPEEFYRVAIQLAGELSTFFRPEKRPASFPEYIHDDLQTTFSSLMEELRQLLGLIYERRAIQIPLSEPKYGIYAAKRPDVSLLETAIFVLAANAQVPSDTLRGHFPPQVKIGPVEMIQQLVQSALPGISISPLPVAPRQIPYHAGFTYFELDKQSELWEKIKTSGGMAIHIGGQFPELKLELWAIKEG